MKLKFVIMRNFVPALEESLMKFTAEDVNRVMPETRYTAHNNWFGMEKQEEPSSKRFSKKRLVKGPRA